MVTAAGITVADSTAAGITAAGITAADSTAVGITAGITAGTAATADSTGIRATAITLDSVGIRTLATEFTGGEQSNAVVRNTRTQAMGPHDGPSLALLFALRHLQLMAIFFPIYPLSY